MTAVRIYHLPPNLPDRWTSAWGEDKYGIWSEVEIFGVVQRFRWIEPGTFMMGSPESEPERSDNENQHEVELTQGFWLADTACTQQLWQAVMGENPSRFKGEGLPVEQVSWDDCKSFFEKVNPKMPGMNLQFPTEAEWEYACRAEISMTEKTTPFSFGENITTEQVNYDGDFPYAGGKKGEDRGKTVPVKELPPNQWGLYQMHGNIFEWCEDWLGDYPTGRVVDPKGPDKGEDRVLRGGSWSRFGWWCRSAHRNGYHPGFRFDFFGFRLSRGPVEPGQDTGR